MQAIVRGALVQNKMKAFRNATIRIIKLNWWGVITQIKRMLECYKESATLIESHYWGYHQRKLYGIMQNPI
jgi:hypothetical protein